MDQKEKQMVEQIMNTEAIGYAYLYPAAGGQRKGYLLLAVEKGQKGYLPISSLPYTAMGMEQSSRSYLWSVIFSRHLRQLRSRPLWC